MATKLRYYIHGDEKEGNPELYFCAGCDLFVEQGHFYAEDRLCKTKNDFERYSWSLKRLKLSLKGGRKFHRPNNPPNLWA